MIGKRFKELREQVPMSQYELAKLTGIAQPTIWRIETGRSQPRAATIRTLAKGLGVSPKTLMEGSDEAE